MATTVECEGEAEKRRRLLLRTGGKGGAATVAAEGMGGQKMGCDRRQRSLPHALPSRASRRPSGSAAIGPVPEGPRRDSGRAGPSPRVPLGGGGRAGGSGGG